MIWTWSILPFSFIHKYNIVKSKSTRTQWTEGVLVRTRFSQDREASSENGEKVVVTIRDEIHIPNTIQAYVGDESNKDETECNFGEEEKVKKEQGLKKRKLNKCLSCFFGLFVTSPRLNIIFQGLPYLVIRLLVVLHKGGINYTTSSTTFFAGKNALVILVHCYSIKITFPHKKANKTSIKENIRLNKVQTLIGIWISIPSQIKQNVTTT